MVKARRRKRKFDLSKFMKGLQPVLFLISIICIVLGAIGIAYSAYLYMVGFHNMDLAHNMAVMSNIVNNEFNTSINYKDLVDEYDTGKAASYSAFYLAASKMMPAALYYMLASSMVFMAGIFSVIVLYDARVAK